VKSAAPAERLAAAAVFAGVAVVFAAAAMGAAGVLDLDRLLGPCGFQQTHGIPCPTCGMVRSFMFFVRGRLLRSFYIQPAGAFLCIVLAAAGFFAFSTAVFGIKSRVLTALREVGIGYLVLAALAILAGGWAVTLARAMAGR
jgi:hypothetical protein